MAEKIEEITINYSEDERLLVKELDKEILSKGSWTTILFKYQELNKMTEEYGKVKYSIRRYRKLKGKYIQQSKFNISSNDQASKIVNKLNVWLAEEE